MEKKVRVLIVWICDYGRESQQTQDSVDSTFGSKKRSVTGFRTNQNERVYSRGHAVRTKHAMYP
jgi:glutamine synthetase type III